MDKLRYKNSAHMWIGCLPQGNGNIGTMISGGVSKDTIYVNDDTLWSGYPKDDRKDLTPYIDRARELIFGGKMHEVSKYLEENIKGDWSESYMPLGSINIRYSNRNILNADYERCLNLNTGIHMSMFSSFGHKHKREHFVSYQDKIGVYRASSDNKFKACISVESKLHSEVIVDRNIISIVGNAPDKVFPNYVRNEKNPIRYDEHKGMAFAMSILVKTDGVIKKKDDAIKVVDASYIELYYTTKTGYRSFDTMPISDRKVVLNKAIDALTEIKSPYEEIKNRHIDDFSSLYNRIDFSICKENGTFTSKLVKNAKKGRVSNELMQLFYNYGRYLIISGSRKGSQALNLQGIWNNSIRPPWSSNYTTNINTEMNYFSLRGMNTDECFYPYLDFMRKIQINGQKTAKDCFNAHGFVANHNVDIWAKTTPVVGPSNWAYYPMAGVWLCNELYDMFRFNNDLEYLKEISSIVTDNVLFINDYLVEHDGKLVTCPSTSPEIAYSTKDGDATVGISSAHDVGLIISAYQNYLDMASRLGIEELVDVVKANLLRLKLFSKDSQGALMEWSHETDIREIGHRHFSPLYSIFPSTAKSKYIDEEYSEMARTLLNRRINAGSGQTGWSASWAISLYAKFKDGNMAYKMFARQMSKSITKNLFDLHPVFIFQIDGNLGSIQGVHEMLAQVEDGVIELLPALPNEWSDGHISGLRVEGGAIIDMEWHDKKVTKLRIGGIGIKLKNANLSEKLEIQSEISLI